MPESTLIRTLLLPELSLVSFRSSGKGGVFEIVARKKPTTEYCPHCASPSNTGYDMRRVTLKDEPIREGRVKLIVEKRRLQCKPCGKVFTEPLLWARKGHRHTERYGRAVMQACERYGSLADVRKHYACSGGWLYKVLYRHLDLERRKRLYPWPVKIGIDEHFFGRKQQGFREFVSVIVDQKNHRLMEVVRGKTKADLEAALDYIPGRENVRTVAIDMCDPFKGFAEVYFPNATLVADKFHVLRLLNPAIHRYRKAITGDERSLPVRRLLLTNGCKLQSSTRWALRTWLADHAELRQVYEAKERLHALYRIRSHRQASLAFTAFTDALALSPVPELQTFRRTLLKWRKEILAYFRTRATNGMTEGFNNKAPHGKSGVKRKGYGYRSFRNYRLRLLNACA